jgi:hypothetical protein
MKYPFRAAGTVLLGLLSHTTVGATVIFSDTEFADSDWTTTTIFQASGVTATNFQQLSGGFPGAFRQFTTSHTGGGNFVNLQAHIYNRLYDPGVLGAIDNVVFSFDAAGFPGQGPTSTLFDHGFVLEQAGVFYGGICCGLDTTTGKFYDLTSVGATADSFNRLSGGIGSFHPDFSASGAPIRFGYATDNSFLSFTGLATRVGGIDNWFVIITQAARPPTPPSVTCPLAAWTECGSPGVATIHVSDPDGDALTIIWTVNGVPAQTNIIAETNPRMPISTNINFSSSLPLGTNVLIVTVNDSSTNSTSCSTTIAVLDSKPPTITGVSAEPNPLWPPNHQMVPVTVRVGATDTCGTVNWKITGVSSNEPMDGKRKGHTGADWLITSDHTLQLRAERSGRQGRIYSITVQATDELGNISPPKIVSVSVPN